MTDKIYNIPAGCAFAEVLAGHFLREYRGRELELTDVLFLLPNRRAVKALKDAFVRLQGWRRHCCRRCCLSATWKKTSCF